MTIESINPATGEHIKKYEEMRREEARKVVEKTHESFLSWKRTDFSERSDLLKRLARILLEKEDECATLITQEMGKPLKESQLEIEKCSRVCEYYAVNAETFLQSELIETDASKSFVTFQPLGVLLAVMPWNFPFWQVFRFAAPAIMAGNTVLLKHASNVPGCALTIEKIFHRAGPPTNLFRTLLVKNDKVNSVIENRMIKAVTLTGGASAGRGVAKKAGEMLKKTVLELGGSDPYLILEDADLEPAVLACVKSRLINSGQTCISAKRFIVVESIRKKFEELFVEEMSAQKVGDPMEENTTIGPLARYDLRDTLHQQVIKSIAKGARLLLGGEIPEKRGAFYPPTVLTEVRKGMPAYQEELFGPVAAIIPVPDEKEGIRVANDSVFGLGAAVFTKDLARGEKIVTNEIDAGSCFVNDFVKSDPRLPFGGTKESGYGRELSQYGIKEFVNIKTIFLK